MGLYSFNQIYITRFTEQVLVFVDNSVWPFIFAIMVLDLGIIVTEYLFKKTVRVRILAGMLFIISAGVVISSFLDFFMEYTGIYPAGTYPIVLELFAGLALFVIAIVLQSALSKYRSYRTDSGEERWSSRNGSPSTAGSAPISGSIRKWTNRR